MAGGRPRSTAAVASSGARSRRANNRAQPPSAHKLVLNQWLLSLFNVKRFEDLAEPVRNEALEGLDENNVHHFHHALTAQLFNLTQLPTELLIEYDQITHGQIRSNHLHSDDTQRAADHSRYASDGAACHRGARTLSKLG